MRSDDTQITTGALLDSWTQHDWTNGIQIDELPELEWLSVRTRNSTYQIVVTTPSTGEILVRGGARFPAFTPARLCGSSAGGSVLKRFGVYPGFRLEFEVDSRRIITSPIMSIELDPPTAKQ
jgi:hypothetical protein